VRIQLLAGVKFPPSKPEDELFAPHELQTKSASRTTSHNSKPKKSVDPSKLKDTLAPMKEAVSLLQEMLDALEPSENPDKDSVIVGLVDQLRQAKPQLISIIEDCVDNEKLTEALMSLFDTMDDLLSDYEHRAGLRSGSSKSKSKSKSKSSQGVEGASKRKDTKKGKAQEDSEESDDDDAILESFKYDPAEDEEELHRLRREPVVPTPVPAAAAGLQPPVASAAPSQPQPDPFTVSSSAASPYRIIEPQRLQALYSMYPPYQQPVTTPTSAAFYPASAPTQAATPAYTSGTPVYMYQPAAAYGYPPAALSVAGGSLYPTATTATQNPFVGPASTPTSAAPSNLDLGFFGSASSSSPAPSSSGSAPAASDPLLDWLIAPAVRQAAVSATTTTTTTTTTSAQPTSPRKHQSASASAGSALGPPPSSHRTRSRSRPVDN
jgi:hypothetical protein